MKNKKSLIIVFTALTLCVFVISAILIIKKNGNSDPAETEDSAESTDGADETKNEDTDSIPYVESDRKALFCVDLEYIEPEIRKEKFKSIYGFDVDIYLDDKRLKEEGIPLILGRDYVEGDEYSKEVLEAVEAVRSDYSAVRESIRTERQYKIIEDCDCDPDDVYKMDYFLQIYADESMVEKLNAHEYVSSVIFWEDLSSAQVQH